VLRRPVESAQYTSIAFTERLAAVGAAPSVGSVGDALDNTLAETHIGLFKTELIRRRGPWSDSTTGNWRPSSGSTGHNNRRLHTACHDLTPVEYE
jgi:putative transposase